MNVGEDMFRMKQTTTTKTRFTQQLESCDYHNDAGSF